MTKQELQEENTKLELAVDFYQSEVLELQEENMKMWNELRRLNYLVDQIIDIENEVDFDL